MSFQGDIILQLNRLIRCNYVLQLQGKEKTNLLQGFIDARINQQTISSPLTKEDDRFVYNLFQDIQIYMQMRGTPPAPGRLAVRFSALLGCIPFIIKKSLLTFDLICPSLLLFLLSCTHADNHIKVSE